MRLSILVIASGLSACERSAGDLDAAALPPATVREPSWAPAAEHVADPPRQPRRAPESLRLHVVAERRAPLALEVDETMELLRATIEIVELRGDGPLVREPNVLSGMSELTLDFALDGTEKVQLGARWPHFAMLVVSIWGEADGIDERSMLWNGERWRRDDSRVGPVRRIHAPLGPYTSGTLLTRIEAFDALDSPYDHPRLRRARSKTLMRRLPDGTERAGPREPPWPRAVVASAASGHVFAGGVGQLATWSPDHGAWTTSEPPGMGEAVVAGFRVFASDDVLAFGSQDADGGRGWLAHYDGMRWSAVPGPACPTAIERVARHDRRVWVMCAIRRDLEDETLTAEANGIWMGDGAGRWTQIVLVRDANDPRVVTARVLATGSAPHALGPAWAPDGMVATDLASTRDGALWIVVRGDLGEADERAVQRWLVRTGTPAPVLVLPTSDELAAAVQAIGR